jgi:rfaE bifunctional protein kinase chain/domain
MTLPIDRVRTILGGFSRQRVLVVGDLMLDRYIYGSVRRISPEAPVPVVEVSDEKNMPGGASNVAWNIQRLGGQAVAAGILGQDAAAADLRELLSRGGVSVEASLDAPYARTTVKTRIIAERQQVVRVDWDARADIPDAVVDEFCGRVEKEVPRCAGVVIEDYGKGVVNQVVVDRVIRAARAAGIPTGFDPKENHELDMAGITVATPNRKEAFSIAQLPDSRPHPHPLEDARLLQAGRKLMEKWGPELLIITLGPLGMLLMSGADAPRHVPTRAREVFDVSGAGDTVIAVAVLALAAGASHLEAAELANYAAGVVVGKLGTATCTQEELLAYMT